MNTSKSESDILSLYACPSCKGSLEPFPDGLHCEVCNITYPVIEGIPDFLLEDREQSLRPLLRYLTKAIVMLYETRLWYVPILKMAGGKDAPTYDKVKQLMGEMMPIREGLLLDVACGPGTWGRRQATPDMEVYGIDISWSMLRQGQRIVRSRRIFHMNFAHARVEALPFGKAVFDAAYCGGALHGFTDPPKALSEIGRTLKPQAPLVVLTFLNRGQPLMERRRKAEARNKEMVHLHFFELHELEQYCMQAGFKHFEPCVYGGIVIFRVEKA